MRQTTILVGCHVASIQSMLLLPHRRVAGGARGSEDFVIHLQLSLLATLRAGEGTVGTDIPACRLNGQECRTSASSMARFSRAPATHFFNSAVQLVTSVIGFE